MQLFCQHNRMISGQHESCWSNIACIILSILYKNSKFVSFYFEFKTNRTTIIKCILMHQHDQYDWKQYLIVFVLFSLLKWIQSKKNAKHCAAHMTQNHGCSNERQLINIELLVQLGWSVQFGALPIREMRFKKTETLTEKKKELNTSACLEVYLFHAYFTILMRKYTRS